MTTQAKSLNAMKTRNEILDTIKGNDIFELDITQKQLEDIGWEFNGKDYDQFYIDELNGKIRLVGQKKVGYNPGYGVTNAGQQAEYDEGTVIASGKSAFGGHEGLDEFFELIL